MPIAAGPTIEEVYDLIYGRFKEEWDANAGLAIGGAVPEIVWPDDEQLSTQLQKGDVPWCRVYARHTMRDERSIGNELGVLIQAEGYVVVNIFARAGKRGLVNTARLGMVAVDAFEGKQAGEVRFSEVTPMESGVDGAWYQMNVKAKFRYDNRR